MADKPAGMAVYPDHADGTGTLVNALLQSNRWLAEMESSHRPGVIHNLAARDRGLVLAAKNDDTAEILRAQYESAALTFSYRVRLPASVTPNAEAPVTVVDRREFADGTAVLDVDSPIGDTAELRAVWIPGTDDASFVLYRMAIPMGSRVTTVALGDRMWLPDIELYTAPP